MAKAIICPHCGSSRLEIQDSQNFYQCKDCDAYIDTKTFENQKISIFKRIYRKIVFHLLLDTLIIPTLSFCAVSLKPVLLIALKPVVALITFLSALAVGLVGFMGSSSANEIVDLTSNELVEGSESNILEIILDFFF